MSGLTKLKLPLFISPVKAGFPSPADDFIDRNLDLNDFLIKHPAATFFVRVSGDSMKNAGINSGDLLIVDRSIQTYNKAVVVAILNGEFTVKRFIQNKREITLVPENENYPLIKITEQMNFEVWGVVSYVIHTV